MTYSKKIYCLALVIALSFVSGNWEHWLFLYPIASAKKQAAYIKIERPNKFRTGLVLVYRIGVKSDASCVFFDFDY